MPTPQIEVGDLLGVADRLEHEAREGLFARRRRLQEAAGRGRHASTAHLDFRRTTLDQRDAVIGDAGKVEFGRRRYQALLEREVELAAAANVDVEPVEAGGDLEIERLFERREDQRKLAQDGQGVGKFRRKNGAGVDFDDAMRPRLHESDMGQAALVVARMESGASPPGAPGFDQRADLGFDSLDVHAGVAQRLDHQFAFPRGIGGLGQRLHGAAAADW